MTYACYQCGADTEVGSMLVFSDKAVMVPLCPVHRAKLTKQMKADGVPVQHANRLN